MIRCTLANRCLFTATLLFFFCNTFSQKNEFTGYYIKLTGDTVKGVFTNYRQWGNNPDRVGFIPTSTGTELQLTPTSCQSFLIDNNDTYVSYKGPRLTNPIDFNNAQNNTADAFETITTFLRQAAATEKLKLYVYKESSRINLFYKENNNTIIELQQKGAVVNNSFWESMTYKQQLKELFPSEKDKEKINQLNYTEESIGSFVNKQNKVEPNLKKPNSNFDGLLIMAGASLNSLKFSGDKSVVYSSKDYPTNITPVIAVGYKFSINRNFGKLFLFPQLIISSFKHTATTFYNSTTPYPAQVNTFQSSPTISFGLHFGYNIVNKQGLKLFIAPGAGITILSKNKQTDKTQFSITEERTIVTPQPNTTYLLDVQGGLIVVEKFIIWGSYNLPATITSYSSNKGNLSSVRFGLGYKL